MRRQIERPPTPVLANTVGLYTCITPEISQPVSNLAQRKRAGLVSHKLNKIYQHPTNTPQITRRSLDRNEELLNFFLAQFYETVEECNNILITLDEDHQRGKKYKQLMRKIKDEEYRERWFEFGAVDDD